MSHDCSRSFYSHGIDLSTSNVVQFIEGEERKEGEEGEVVEEEEGMEEVEEGPC